MEQDPLKLENQICFMVYAAAREITKQYRPLLEKLDVTYPQYLVLLVLWEQREVSVKELGKKLFLDSGTLTPMLKRMESHELILRQRSKQDERSVMVSLTEKGEALQEEAACIPGALLENMNLDDQELFQLKKSLGKILNSIQED
ncbi:MULTISPECIES: MarR family winged helix-turn-helix transcriptional regulator [Fictibacillus]|uniref:MarR family transcriptional regulator n=1 Tax=Fictibacillus enclensis TaxID=1017270 RepID=A0A0V8JBC9_9BACL|nr:MULTISPECIES: MarR family transcriptional regulator [Fictibacillus]KSU84307.1 MarR family transcriptional regulator [Fictibacillus enclensis]MDM5197979.1 MarR family transcriptional regulator [Fictibacillus enclensis]RXZ00069.1 MarR family transcriptional regulator [Fictibacillus sp. S7]SCB76922.1 DNA-binding transcriptional regulator, MarR family [Fictibacillus enclensis]